MTRSVVLCTPLRWNKTILVFWRVGAWDDRSRGSRRHQFVERMFIAFYYCGIFDEQPYSCFMFAGYFWHTQ